MHGFCKKPLSIIAGGRARSIRIALWRIYTAPWRVCSSYHRITTSWAKRRPLAAWYAHWFSNFQAINFLSLSDEWPFRKRTFVDERFKAIFTFRSGDLWRGLEYRSCFEGRWRVVAKRVTTWQNDQKEEAGGVWLHEQESHKRVPRAVQPLEVSRHFRK